MSNHDRLNIADAGLDEIIERLEAQAERLQCLLAVLGDDDNVVEREQSTV